MNHSRRTSAGHDDFPSCGTGPIGRLRWTLHDLAGIIRGGRRRATGLATDGIPALTADQMREVDRRMIEDYHVGLIQMMENAGRNLAELALRRFNPTDAVVLAGPGGNGGGGLVAARHLVNRGVAVQVVLGRPEPALATAHQLDILSRMGVVVDEEPRPAALTLDALTGYGLRGDPSGRPAELIVWVNAQRAPILALDTPSGLDVTTGRPGRPCVLATATLTLALPKTGLIGASQVGELYLADISVPPVLYREMGIEVPPLFGPNSVIRLVTEQVGPGFRRLS
jgi:NAD(P)H-hydrate epimerase